METFLVVILILIALFIHSIGCEASKRTRLLALMAKQAGVSEEEIKEALKD